MRNLHAQYLTAGDVRKIVEPILKQGLEDFDYQSVEVAEEEDFDGHSVLRAVASVQRRVPAKRLIDLTERIGEALRAEGDDRFLYLSTRRPGSDARDEGE